MKGFKITLAEITQREEDNVYKKYIYIYEAKKLIPTLSLSRWKHLYRKLIFWEYSAESKHFLS